MNTNQLHTLIWVSRHFFAVFLSVAVLFSASVTAHAQSLKKEQVVELAETILGLESFAKYKGTFAPREKDRISYGAKDGTWRVMAYGGLEQSYPDAPLYFFEIRDCDGFFKIGALQYIGGFIPKSSEKFRTHPTAARKYRQLTGKK